MATYNGDSSQSKRARNDDKVSNNFQINCTETNNTPKIDTAIAIRRKRPDLPPNHVLLYTILNPRYPITTEVINTISSPVGKVNRIVIFRKRAVQAMVEFADVETAKRAKEALDGADIYSGCCTLKIEFAKPTKLNVFRNDLDSWDFTIGKTHTSNRPALLPEPVGKGLLQTTSVQPIQIEIDRTRPSSYLGGIIAPPPPALPPPPLPPPPPPPPPTSPVMSSMEVVPSGVSTNNNDTLGSITVTSIEKSTTAVSVGTLTTFQPAPIASSPVLMVYDLDPLRTNCDRLFNLFCLYGNVVRIKFLKTKEGCAMVQMSDQYAVDRCMANLNPTDMLDGRELSLGYSKQPFVSENRGSFTLPDGTEGFKDYSSHRHNRYYNRVSSLKNRIQPPSRILHFYNTPTNISEEELVDVFNSALEGIRVVRLKLFPKRGGVDGIVRSSTGLVEFKSVPESVEALMTCNHLPVKSQGNKFPYIMKLCFSAAKSIHHIPREKSLTMSGSTCDKCKK
ncbi:heterogeneous nuclear ribonucleoprotein L isoform X2 [Planococcus citri]|uniref:heterogeneous nuclear ribonucleoprotein L isoform X2 n=1 Tax=Planococcus citri TaxID=170843 RepID=UPI0031FA46FD